MFHGLNAPAPRSNRDRLSRAAMRLRGVALNTVRPAMTAFAVSRCMAASVRLDFQRLGIVLHQGKPAKALLEPLGDRDLRHRAPKDELPGGIEPAVRQGVNDVIPSAGLDLVERLGRLGTALAGQERHNRKVGGGASRHGGNLYHPAAKAENLARNPLKGQHPQPTSRNFAQPRNNAR